MKDDEIKLLIEKYNDRLKKLLIEVIQLEKKIERNNKDVWEYLAELTKNMEASKFEPRH